MNKNVYSMVKTAGMVMPYHTATGPSGSQPHELGGEYGQRNVERCGGYKGIAAASGIAAAAGLGAALTPVGPYMTNYLRTLTPASAGKAAVPSAASWAWDNRGMLMDLANKAYTSTVKPQMSNMYNTYALPVKSTVRNNAGSIAQAALNPVATSTSFALNNAGKVYDAAKRYAAPVVKSTARGIGNVIRSLF